MIGNGWLRWGMSLLLVGAINAIVAACEPAVVPAPAGEQSDPAPILPEKRLKIGTDAKKWEDVFAWLTRETGVPVVANSYPTGVFAFPGSPEKEYSVGEVIDLINIGLSKREGQKYILLVEKVFILVGADEKIDGRMRFVTLEDLPKQRPTALVRCKWQIKGMAAADLAAELKPLLGPLGRIDVLSRNNTILITDIAANLQRLNKIIVADCGETRVFKRIDLPAGHAEVVAKAVTAPFKDSGVIIEPVEEDLILVYATPTEHTRIAQVVRECLDRGALDCKTALLRTGTVPSEAVVERLTRLYAKIHASDNSAAPYIALYGNGNGIYDRIYVRGTAGQIADITQVVKRLVEEGK